MKLWRCKSVGWLLCCVTAFASSITNASNASLVNQIQRLLDSEQPKEIDKWIAEMQKSGLPSAELSFFKGLIHMKRGKHDDAVAAFLFVPPTSPYFLDARNNLAIAYAFQGKTALANSTLEEALNTNPSVGLISRNLNELRFYLANRSHSLALQALDATKASKPVLVVATGLKQLAEPEAPAKPEPARMASVSVVAPVIPSNVAETPASPRTATSPNSVDSLTHEAVVQAANRALLDWGKAWERKDLVAYLAAYAQDFQPADGKSLAQWRKERQDRIVSKGRIQIQISQIKLNVVDPKHVSIRFVQNYRSESLNVTSQKTVDMKFDENRWLITRERNSESKR